MPSPVIFDDGGSTRIQHLVDQGVGAMDGLLNVNTNVNPPQSSHTVDGPFTRLSVVTIDTIKGPSTPFDSEICPNDTFTICSDNGQTVEGSINDDQECKIVLEGSQNNPPLVESIQFKKKRRYVVVNAGPIQSITVTVNGANTQIATASLYTMLVLS